MLARLVLGVGAAVKFDLPRILQLLQVFYSLIELSEFDLKNADQASDVRCDFTSTQLLELEEVVESRLEISLGYLDVRYDPEAVVERVTLVSLFEEEAGFAQMFLSLFEVISLLRVVEPYQGFHLNTLDLALQVRLDPLEKVFLVILLIEYQALLVVPDTGTWGLCLRGNFLNLSDQLLVEDVFPCRQVVA